MRSKLLYVIMLGLIVMVSACASSGDKWEKDSADNGDYKENGWKKSSATTGGQEGNSDSSYWSEKSRY